MSGNVVYLRPELAPEVCSECEHESLAFTQSYAPGGCACYCHPRPGDVTEPAGARPAALTDAQAADLAQAELFLLSLDTATENASAARVSYLLGLGEGHLANLIELARAVTQ
jgi:hypothetical protein